MLAALSVTFGFLPPHPSPSALVVQFHADMGLTLIYGLVLAVPAIIIAGPMYSQFLKNIKSVPLQAFQPPSLSANQLPSAVTSLLSALLPVVLLMLTTLVPYIFSLTTSLKQIVAFFAEPATVMLISLAVATYTLGIKRGKSMKEVMSIYADAVKEIAMILLIIGCSGALKQVLTDSGISNQIASQLNGFHVQPLILAWLIAAVIRICVGSATVAGLTTAGIVAPLIVQTHSNPNLMVLSIGAGSLAFSHVNDSGFWLFKEYFNLSIKDTVRSWTAMETIVAVVGLAGVLVLNIII
jgi:Gnt-I system high-affinity gluconate transporter